MITKELMEVLFPTKGLSPRKFNLVKYRDELIEALNEFLPKYGINNYKRVCAFLATCGTETDYFRTTTEYASGDAYDIKVNPRKARELGNIYPGDGRKFKGSGLGQATGRSNFIFLNGVCGKRLNVDLVAHPELLRTDIRLAVESACILWQHWGLNDYADAMRFKEINGLWNRGDKDLTPLHWEKRNALYSLCKRRVPQNVLSPVVVTTPQVAVQNDDPQVNTQPMPNVQTPEDHQDDFLNRVDFDKVSSHYDDVRDIAQRPSTKSVAKKAGFAFLGKIGLIWETTTGKICLVLSLVACVTTVAYICYLYRNQIKSAGKRFWKFAFGYFLKGDAS